MPIPPLIALNRVLGRIALAANSTCLELGPDCSAGLIRSHSIQNGVILDQIAENNHVCVLRHARDEPVLEFIPEGRNQASTFSGLCNHHDTLLFREIDYHSVVEINPDNKVQQCLHFLRATAIELLKKRAAAASARALWLRDVSFIQACREIDFDPERLNPSDDTYKYRHIGTNKGAREVAEQYAAILATLSSQNYHLIQSRHFTIDVSAPLAISSTLSPTQDLNGQELYNVDEVIERMLPMPHMSLTVLPRTASTIVLFSYRRRDRTTFGPLFNQLDALGTADREIALSRMVMNNCENVVYKPSRIAALSAADKRAIIEATSASIDDELRLDQLPAFNLFRI